MADLALDLTLGAIAGVLQACENARANKGKAKRLAAQWVRTQDCLAKADSSGQASYTRSLDATRALAEETIQFVGKFKNKSYLRKVWSHASDKDTFLDLGGRLSVLMQEMNLGCVFDAAELLSSHDADVEEIEQAIAESEARIAAGNEAMEARLIAAIRSGEAAAAGSGGSGGADQQAIVAQAVSAQVADALAQQAREYASIVGAKSDADQAEVRQLVLDAKAEIVERLRTSASPLSEGVSPAALEAALGVTMAALEARFDQLEAKMASMEARLSSENENMGAVLLAAIEDLARAEKGGAAAPPPRRMRRQSMTAKLQELRAEDVEILGVLGEGSFGQVCKGRYQHEFVAVKKLKNVSALSPKAVDQFKREAAVMQKLNHPFVIHIWGMCTDPANAFICVELAERGTLKSYLYGGGIFPELHLVSLLQNIGVALAFTHEVGGWVGGWVDRAASSFFVSRLFIHMSYLLFPSNLIIRISLEKRIVTMRRRNEHSSEFTIAISSPTMCCW